MRRGFVIALALIAGTQSSAAACHHFRVWRYPWAQRCGSQVSRPEARVDVEIEITGEQLDKWARDEALDELRGRK